MRVVWIVLPLAAALVAAGIGRLVGRPLGLSRLRLVVAVVALYYVTGTAVLGLFWMARMELPPFDLHYLFGYCLLAAVAWHLWLEWPSLWRLLRGAVARSRFEAGRRPLHGPLRSWVALVAMAVLGASLAAFRVWWTGRPPAATGVEASGGSGGGEKVGFGDGADRPEVSVRPLGVRSGGPVHVPREDPQAVRIALYLLRESSADLRGLVRANLFFGARPRPTPVVLPRLGLPPPKRSDVQVVDVQGLENLGRLLYHVSGVTAERRLPGGKLGLRAAASAGALYPVRTYLWWQAPGDGVPGLWLYLPEEHALARVRSELRAGGLASALGVEGSDPPLIVLTVRFQNTVWKYGPRSYRYVVLDAGHVAANLWLVARELGFVPVVRELFDDEALARRLGLDPQEEAAVLAVGLRGRPDFRGTAPPFEPVPDPGEWDGRELTRLSHRLSSWRWREGERWRYLPHGAGPGFPERDPLAGEDPLALIRRRRSFRRFSRRPIDEPVLREVLAEIGRLARGVPLDRGLGVRVVACRVAGLPPGTYVWEGGWVARWRGNASARIYRAGLSQELLRRAAAAVVFTVNLDRVTSQLGVRGLRVGLLHAGMAGELVYLAAEARGLGACGVGAFADSALRELLGEMPEHEVPVYLVALGHRR